MTDDFSITDVAVAASQGWKLELIYDTRGYFAHAVVPAAHSSFKFPYDVMQFVWSRAKLNDAVCQRALRLVSASELAGKSKTKKARK